MISHLALHYIVKAIRDRATDAQIRAFAMRAAWAGFAGLILGFGISTSVLFGVIYASLWMRQARARQAAAAVAGIETAPAAPAADVRAAPDRQRAPVAPKHGVVLASAFNETPRQRARRLAAEEKLARAQGSPSRATQRGLVET